MGVANVVRRVSTFASVYPLAITSNVWNRRMIGRPELWCGLCTVLSQPPSRQILQSRLALLFLAFLLLAYASRCTWPHATCAEGAPRVGPCQRARAHRRHAPRRQQPARRLPSAPPHSCALTNSVTIVVCCNWMPPFLPYHSLEPATPN
eukprot:5011824-Pleurochrysis_carterae.AAC.2